MPRTANVIEILIASPSDVSAERGAIRDAIYEWNVLHSRQHQCILLPVMWETHTVPSFGERPQAIVNQQIVDGCDALIGTFWTRLGSPTGVAASGTVEEIERIHASGREVMLYFSNAPVPPSDIDEKQLSALRAFRSECASRGLYHEYSTCEELRKKLVLALTRLAEKLGARPSNAIPQPDQRSQQLANLRQAVTRWRLEAKHGSQGQDTCRELMRRYVDWYVKHSETLVTFAPAFEALTTLAGRLVKSHLMGREPLEFFFDAGEAVLATSISLIELGRLEPSLNSPDVAILSVIWGSKTKDQRESAASIAAQVQAPEDQVQESLTELERIGLVDRQLYFGGSCDYGLTGSGYVRALLAAEAGLTSQ